MWTSVTLLTPYFHLREAEEANICEFLSRFCSLIISKLETLQNRPEFDISFDWAVRPELPVGGVLHHAVNGLQQLHHGEVLYRNPRGMFREQSHLSMPPILVSYYLWFGHLDGNALDLQLKICLRTLQLQLSARVDAYFSRSEDWFENFREKNIYG